MKIIYLFIIIVCSISSAYAQKIDKIGALKEGNEIVISYELSEVKFYQILDISLYVSKDNGQSWLGPLKKISGDIGQIETPGLKSITWDVLSELQIMEEDFIFDIQAEVLNKKIKKRVFVEYVGNAITPFGARIGLLSKTGFYIEGRASSKFNSSSKYSYANKLIDNYDRSGYYIFNGNSYYDAFSFSAGITYQLSRSTYLYGGAGYGSQKKIAEIDQYEYKSNDLISTEFATNSEEDYSGVELSTGLIVNYKNLLVSAGATALNFEVFNFTAGVGFLF